MSDDDSMVDIPFYAELLARVLGGVFDQDELEHEELRLEGARDALGLVLGPAGRAQVSDDDSMVDIPFYAELLARVLGGVFDQDELEHEELRLEGARDALGLVLGPAGQAQVSDEDSMADIPFYFELLVGMLGGVLIQDELEHVELPFEGARHPRSRTWTCRTSTSVGDEDSIVDIPLG